MSSVPHDRLKERFLEMEKLDEEVIAPEKFLKFSKEKLRNIKKIRFSVRPFDNDDLNDSDMGSLLVTWDTPRYSPKL